MRQPETVLNGCGMYMVFHAAAWQCRISAFLQK